MGSSILDEDYKRLHEEFMSNHNGTSAQEIMLVSCSIPLAVLLNGLCQLTMVSSPSTKFSLVEFCFFNVPLLLCLTCCSEPMEYLAIFLIIFLAIFSLYAHLKSNSSRIKWEKSEILELELAKANFYPFITNYRSSMLLTTAVCILAVDFQVFPRRFAKSESFGFGLMDIGVGSFVFAAGLVSQEARKGIDNKRSTLSYLKKSLLESLPLLMLGLIRLVSVKGSGYHEHVTEYGVHWNFFFTLAFTKIFSSLLFCVMPVGQSWNLALFVGLIHEGVLNIHLASWVLSPDTNRSNLFSANREGICSIPGYVAIFLSGVSWGHHFAEIPKNNFRENLSILRVIGIWTTVMWASLLYSKEELFLPPSRRLANWNYLNWMIAFNLSLLFMFLSCDLFLTYASHLQTKINQTSRLSKPNKGGNKGNKKSFIKPNISPDSDNKSNSSNIVPRCRVSKSFMAISANGMAFFLLANIITGILNFSIKTMEVSNCPAILILLSYLILLNLSANYAYTKNIRLKFW